MALSYHYLLESTASQNEKVDPLPLLGLYPATFSTPAHRFDHKAKATPHF
jgi:hypothetical protein